MAAGMIVIGDHNAAVGQDSIIRDSLVCISEYTNYSMVDKNPFLPFVCTVSLPFQYSCMYSETSLHSK